MGGVTLGQAHDEYVGCDLDDTGDGVIEGVHQDGLDHLAGPGSTTHQSSRCSTAVMRIEPSARTARFSRKYFCGKTATGVSVTVGSGGSGMIGLGVGVGSRRAADAEEPRRGLPQTV